MDNPLNKVDIEKAFSQYQEHIKYHNPQKVLEDFYTYFETKNKENFNPNHLNSKFKDIDRKLVNDTTHKKIDLAIQKLQKRFILNEKGKYHYQELIFSFMLKGVKKSFLKKNKIENLQLLSITTLKLMIFKDLRYTLRYFKFLNSNKRISLQHFDFFKKPISFKEKEERFIALLLNNISDYECYYSKKEGKIFVSDNFNYEKKLFNLNIIYNVPLNLNVIRELARIKNTFHNQLLKNKLNIRKSEIEKNIDKIIKESYKKYYDIAKELNILKENNKEYNFFFKLRDNNNLKNNLIKALDKKVENLEKEYSQLAFQNNIGKRRLKEMYPIARNKQRHFTFFIGETGAGKTYHALQKLEDKESGLFLAPLRLLALEGQENIENIGHSCNLVTGEEQDIKEDAMFCSSTIEMLDVTEEYDIVVIDECQLIFDPDRGWAWTQAIVGANADEIVLTGSLEALSAIKYLTEYTGDTLEVVQLQKKTTTKEYPEKISGVEDIPENSAVVCFSKKRILELKNQYESKTGKQASVVFGALSPETRKEEARRFREGETKVVFATDAIGLGLNLPIQHVFFDSLTKFNGTEEVTISSSLAKQIAGRAGRYGFFEIGYYGMFAKNSNKQLNKLLKSDYPRHDNEFYYKVPFFVFQEISDILKTENCYSIIRRFIQLYDLVEENFVNMDYTDLIFKAEIIEDALEKEKSDVKILNLYEKYKLIFSPIDVPNDDNKTFFYNMVTQKLIKLEDYDFKKELSSSLQSIKTLEDLNFVEYKLKKLDSYHWLSYNFEDIFKIDVNLIKNEKSYLNTMVMFFLKEDGHLYKKCKGCQTFLELSDHNFCEKCYLETFY